MHPLLEALKARSALFVEDHHFAVQHESIYRQCEQRTSELRKHGGCVLASAEAEFDAISLALCEEPVAIIFELEEPAAARKRMLSGICKHEADVACVYAPLWRSQTLQLRPDRGCTLAAIDEFVEGEARKNRFLGEGGAVGG